MKYMLMMFGDADVMTRERSPEWVAEMMAFMGGFNAELEKSGELVEARGLAYPGTAKTVSLVDGQVVVSDGPFAEAKEVLGGYWMIDVASRAEAIAWATRCPASSNEIIEVRQVQEIADFPSDVQAVLEEYPALKAL
jgi:hypothetical protein